MEKKIAFIHKIYPSGGAERITSVLAGYLSRRGYRVYVFVEKLQEDLLNEADRHYITFIPVSFMGSKNAVPGARKIADKINELGIEILVIPGIVLRSAVLAHIKGNTNCKTVFSLHSKPMWEAIGFYRDRSHEVNNSGSLLKMAIWYPARMPFEWLTGSRRRKRIARYRANYLNSDLYTVLCDDYKTEVLEILGHKIATPEHNHIKVIPTYVPPHDYGSPAKKKSVLFVGRLSYGDKRVDRLLDIWAMVYRDFPDWQLDIVGTGAEKERLEKQNLRLGLERVVFHGHTTTPEEYYREASILCLTSTFEGWPLTVAEGQQAGVVPIAFDSTAGIREQITPSGVNGFLVEPFDKAAFACRLAELMADDALREKMSCNAVEKSKEYSRESLLALWDEAFRKLL